MIYFMLFSIFQYESEILFPPKDQKTIKGLSRNLSATIDFVFVKNSDA